MKIGHTFLLLDHSTSVFPLGEKVGGKEKVVVVKGYILYYYISYHLDQPAAWKKSNS